MVTKEYSDTNLNDNILDIGKRRERRVYYKPDGTKTGMLPADTYSLVYYQRKGFKLSPEEKVEGVPCPVCKVSFDNVLGLRTHLTKHVNESKNEEEK